MYMEVGRRIIFDSITGEPIIDFGEMVGDVTERNPMEYIDLPYGQNLEEFKRAKKWHIDLQTKQPVFDELKPIQPTYDELQAIVEMMSEGVI